MTTTVLDAEGILRFASPRCDVCGKATNWPELHRVEAHPECRCGHRMDLHIGRSGPCLHLDCTRFTEPDGGES